MSAQTDEIVTRDEPENRGRSRDWPGWAPTPGTISPASGRRSRCPAMIGLIVITVVFAVLHQGFLSAYNIKALVIQAAPIIVMAMGLIFVLLLGEIDLSAGTTGGLCSAITAVLILRQGRPGGWRSSSA